MTKKEFIEALTTKGEFATKAEAERKTKAFLETLAEGIAKHGSVTFVGFGTFKVVERTARVCRNPKTGEEIAVPAKKAIKFKAGKELLETIK